MPPPEALTAAAPPSTEPLAPGLRPPPEDDCGREPGRELPADVPGLAALGAPPAALPPSSTPAAAPLALALLAGLSPEALSLRPPAGSGPDAVAWRLEGLPCAALLPSLAAAALSPPSTNGPPLASACTGRQGGWHSHIGMQRGGLRPASGSAQRAGRQADGGALLAAAAEGAEEQTWDMPRPECAPRLLSRLSPASTAAAVGANSAGDSPPRSTSRTGAAEGSDSSPGAR
jgi:hypothetical protein